MELYVNNTWTECYGNSYIAEAIAWSKWQPCHDLHYGCHS
jgi:hypothetical protein